ncbi:MAG TPA: HTH domain-containing protein [Polyangia bacterium]|jgi:predicted DNA-binding transcriptional regulator YafY|nr:HTH domain-containing protein [Polyangia bacterium]HWE31797.1 HTH domain-containing protein [Polyangia bacterium]
MRRRERLFAITEHLRGRRSGVTAETLATRFGVTVRTIYRDLDSLRDAELPVKAERGAGGGYALDRAYTLPPVNFTPREAALLVALGRWADELRIIPFVETLAGALDKVRGALGASAQRELVEHIDSIQFVGVPALGASPAIRAAIESAWFERQPLRIRYRGADDIVSTRVVRLVTVVMERSLTLLNCDDLDKGERRQFRLDRILEATPV